MGSLFVCGLQGFIRALSPKTDAGNTVDESKASTPAPSRLPLLPAQTGAAGEFLLQYKVSREIFFLLTAGEVEKSI